MLQYNNIRHFCLLPEGAIALDATSCQPCGFISHAHSDHTGKHELTYCTAETESICRYRMKCKPTQQFRVMEYFKPVTLGGLELTAYPAGHCLGSAMLFAKSLASGKTLLYTGDFKLGKSVTAAEAVVPKADVLVMESTYGSPDYQLPPREQVIAELLETVRDAFANDRSPVIAAYAFGKSQEITKILTDNGFKVQQYDTIYKISQFYEQHNVSLGDVTTLKKGECADEDRVLIVPPASHPYYITHHKIETIMLTGWAMHESTKYRYEVDKILPLSDHADYNELLKTIELCEPNVVYPVHGSPDFVEHLQDKGINVMHIDRATQSMLF
ncbi:MAG: MBL fold metallo-hydrolase [Planctomycetaceae bacterium]|jgi:Cft2 family RNA processing exonuclease|nr:MBL fold metallo-hydrolase [Planctomycetaceae bacterium]